MKRKIKLKTVVQNVHFGKSEITNYLQFKKTKRFQGHPKSGEAYLFISRSGNQLIWITAFEEFIDARGQKAARIESMRHRVTSGVWSPLMLANYAKSVGLDLVGIKTFEEAFEDKRERKRKAA